MTTSFSGGLIVDAGVAARDVQIRLTVAPGEVIAVLGANGAGKSTLLSMISGNLRPDSGSVLLNGRTLVDTSSAAWVPPHQRGVVLLAQEALLFPHMTAQANVAFGPRSRGVSRRDAVAVAAKWLSAVDAEQFSDRRPAQLSGGQAQRVAIARALASEPELLLLDEPMAALDVAVAPALRQLLRTVLRGTGRTALLVTHDLIDALALADRVIVLEGGQIVEDGPARTVLSQPRSSFAARIAGINLISGVCTPDGVMSGAVPVHGMLDETSAVDEPAVALFRPAAVAVHVNRPTGSPRNHFSVIVGELEPRGDVVRVRAEDSGVDSSGLVADITAASAADLELVPGKQVYFAVKATEVTIYPSTGAG